ncbi:aminotransferase class V-fold PLP-dependent enzyme [Fusobacterium sp.]|uniref:aminotransferase class V-fold PLP-dependent enzyme n=1 Tax=Fusobacterium sp. TaxID=68766 RepID=UPI002603448E|nr:aminotransferase class V-fold PLP-dependent enzyme [Fusobacterium sp.]
MNREYYFDHSATSNPKPKQVIDSVVEALTNFNGNPSRSSCRKSIEIERRIFGIREKIANFFNIKNPLQIAFTKNSTESLNFAIKGSNLENCNIITSVIEHNSVLRPLNSLRDNKNVSLSYIHPHKETSEVINEILSLITPNTKAIVLNHISNVTGYIFDIEAIGKICKKYNLLFIVDSSQSAGFLPIDVEKSNIDILCFTGHKSLMGIQGIGGIFVREGVELSPVLEGGTGSFSKFERQPQKMPELLEAGTNNIPGIFSLGAGIDYINEIGLDKIRDHEYKLTKFFIDEISKIPEITIYDNFNIFRGPVVAINIKNISSSELSDILSEEFNIYTRSGFHCAPLVHKYLGTYESGCVRFSFGYSNTMEEVLYCINALKEIISFFNN